MSIGDIKELLILMNKRYSDLIMLHTSMQNKVSFVYLEKQVMNQVYIIHI